MKKLNTIAVILTALLAVIFLMNCDEEKADDEGKPSALEGKLLILQAYGSSNSAAGATHSFVELYNTTDAAVKLDGISLYYADGVSGSDEIEDYEWERISLTGTIPAGGSFLVLGPNEGSTVARYKIEEKHGANYGDINDPNFKLSNRSFKAAIIEGSKKLNMQNPFNADGKGKKVSGYIDMVGAVNNPNAATPDNIFGYETAPARNSASEAVRRKNLTDTNDNSTDFIAARYASTGAGAMTNEMLEVRYPRNSTAGKWDPFKVPAAPVPSGNTLLIFQAYGAGFGAELGSNDNTNTGSISHNFIQLYNNSNSPIDLSTYSVQWANGKANGGGTVIAADEDWNVIPLTGTIPAYGSYLIRGRKLNDENGGAKNDTAIGRLQIITADIDDNNFYMSNRSFKIALVSNQTKLTLSQPWNNDSTPPAPFVSELIDLVGVRNGNNDSVEGFKGAMFDTYSKQQSIRRSSLADTGNNKFDFVGLDYRTGTQPGRLTDDQVALLRPRTTTETEDGYAPGFLE